jgi:hypothetical protein
LSEKLNVIKISEAASDASKEVGLEVHMEKTKHMFMSLHQTTGQNHYIKTDNKEFDNEEFKYLGTTLTNKNCIHEKIKSRLNSWNACYHAAQNLPSSYPLIYKRKD